MDASTALYAVGILVLLLCTMLVVNVTRHRTHR